jgi:hypothetical protein
MPKLKSFSLPALQQDFPLGSKEDMALKAQWNTNITGFTEQAILGNPWNVVNAAHQDAYFNSLTTDIPKGSPALLIDWNAFPNRLNQYFGADALPPNPYKYTDDQILELCDTGTVKGLKTPFNEIPKTLCPEVDWSSKGRQIYGPYGPRGWLDEYCEWNVVRNAQNKITRIDFTCENPEYWNSVWMINPQKVADLFEETLNWDAPEDQHIKVDIDDLYLRDPKTKKPIIDPSTGRPAYNSLNKWNTAPIGIRSQGDANTGGAMNLTSTPNTLQTEMALAGGATVQRTIGNNYPQQLICFSEYGQEYRNSDPHIGQSTNQGVSGGSHIALADPTGLYIQKPALDIQNGGPFSLPADPNLPKGATVDDCWQIVRGHEQLTDPSTGKPYGVPIMCGNFILHAIMQIPSAWREAGVKFTIGDIIENNIDDPKVKIPLKWGGQITRQMSIGLWARAIAGTPPPPEGQVGPSDLKLAQPLQMFHADVWKGLYGTKFNTPMNQEMNLASNSTLIAPIVKQGTEGIKMVLTCDTTKDSPMLSFPGGNGEDIIASDITLQSETPSYAVPGNTYPGPVQLLTFTLKIAKDAKPGLRNVQLTNPGQKFADPIPAFLNVVA